MNTNSLKYYIKLASIDDLDKIMTVEQCWNEEGRATREKFISRMERFGRGFFLACINENGREKIVAMITSMPTNYEPDNLSAYKNWDLVTNNGFLPDEIKESKEYNALYIVSGVIDPDYRGHDIFKPMVLKEVELAKSLGMRYVLAGAVIPGLKRYCEKHGNIAPYDYCKLKKGNKLVDPLLSMYSKIDFLIPDKRHVLPEYFPDVASMNYAALVVRSL